MASALHEVVPAVPYWGWALITSASFILLGVFGMVLLTKVQWGTLVLYFVGLGTALYALVAGWTPELSFERMNDWWAAQPVDQPLDWWTVLEASSAYVGLLGAILAVSLRRCGPFYPAGKARVRRGRFCAHQYRVSHHRDVHDGHPHACRQWAGRPRCHLGSAARSLWPRGDIDHASARQSDQRLLRHARPGELRQDISLRSGSTVLDHPISDDRNRDNSHPLPRSLRPSGELRQRLLVCVGEYADRRAHLHSQAVSDAPVVGSATRLPAGGEHRRCAGPCGCQQRLRA